MKHSENCCEIFINGKSLKAQKSILELPLKAMFSPLNNQHKPPFMIFQSLTLTDYLNFHADLISLSLFYPSKYYCIHA